LKLTPLNLRLLTAFRQSSSLSILHPVTIVIFVRNRFHRKNSFNSIIRCFITIRHSFVRFAVRRSDFGRISRNIVPFTRPSNRTCVNFAANHQDLKVSRLPSLLLFLLLVLHQIICFLQKSFLDFLLIVALSAYHVFVHRVCRTVL
uniref:Secreted protein n=1 Tax=Anisakis simplex TaxID=6269 RepID=A0A0M3K5E9_ANISI